MIRIAPAAAAYAVAGRRRPGYSGRYRQRRRERALIIAARKMRPAGKRARNAHHGWMFTSGKIDSRNVVAYPSQYANVPAIRTLANATSRFAPGVHRQGRASPSTTIVPRTIVR